MHPIESLIQGLSSTVRDTWRRLSATQRLTLRGVALLGVLVALGAIVGGTAPRAAASDDEGSYPARAIRSQFRFLRSALDTTSGELELTRIKLERAQALLGYSAKYQIPADLTSLIYDTSLQEGVDPELAFRMVNIESGFRVKAKSPVGDIGLAQVRVTTARFYEPEMTEEQLYDPATNLRIGLRYLHDLLAVYGDTKLALLAYNRGPSRLKELLDQGRDPGNGYAKKIMSGYGGQS